MASGQQAVQDHTMGPLWYSGAGTTMQPSAFPKIGAASWS